MVKEGAKRKIWAETKKEVSEAEKLSHVVKFLEDSYEKLKGAYEKKDAEEFNRLKKAIILAQRKIFSASKITK